MLEWFRRKMCSHPVVARRGSWSSFVCRKCGETGESYADFDLPGEVSPLRRLFSRKNRGETTITTEWEEGEK